MKKVKEVMVKKKWWMTTVGIEFATDRKFAGDIIVTPAIWSRIAGL